METTVQPPLSTPHPRSLPGNRQPFVSFARGFAILTIVAYHILQKASLPPLLFKGILLGGAGIYVYLFLSGYGLALSTSARQGQFWRKRFGKVLLPYYVAVTLIFVINSFIPLYRTDGWQEYLSHLLLYKMFINEYTRNLGEHLWFVSTIIQFYLVLPLLMSWEARSRTVYFLIGILAVSLLYSVLISWLGVAHLRIWYSFFLQYVWVYGLGIVAARRNWLAGWINRPWYVYACLAVGSVAVVLAIEHWIGSAGSVFNDYFMFMGYGSLLVLAYQLSQNWQRLSQFVLWIELYSYSLYLIHMLVFRMYGYTIDYRSLWLPEVLLIGSLAVGAAFVFQKGTDWLLQRRMVKL